MRIFIGFLLVFLSSFPAFAIKLKPGNWIAYFELNKTNTLVVDFVIITKPTLSIQINNGFEELQLINVNQLDDTLTASFTTFASEFKCQINNKTNINGYWFNKAKSDTYSIPFKAKYNKTNESRYIDQAFNHAIFGKWEVTFDYETEPEKAIGIFTHAQSSISDASNICHGTFLTETGDYRYLEGAVLKDSLYISCFDGSHAFLFNACLKEDTLWGNFLSGNHYQTKWYAVKNERFELRNPDSLTYVVTENPISFELMNIDGSMYKYPNELTKNKVVLLQIMGTWCPNCLDESQFLKTIHDQYIDQLDVIAITFETQKTIEEKITKVADYKKALNLNYTFLIGGDACKKCASQLFPQLNEIMSFPTLIIIDKGGNVRKIHTGFSGPGTGKYYADFVSSTTQFIEQLVAE